MTLEIGELRRDGGVRKMVVCEDCGGVFDLAPRTLREIYAQGRLPKCKTCRRPGVTDEARQAAVAFWVEKIEAGEITFDRIVEIAEMMHGPRQSWPEWKARHLTPRPRVLVFTRVRLHVRLPGPHPIPRRVHDQRQSADAA